jgi:hypothetical protein
VGLAREDQSCQAPSGEVSASSGVGRGFGGVVFVPREEQAVIDPRVRKTRSWASTWIKPVLPSLVDAKWISETVMAEPGRNERELTLVSENISAL